MARLSEDPALVTDGRTGSHVPLPIPATEPSLPHKPARRAEFVAKKGYWCLAKMYAKAQRYVYVDTEDPVGRPQKE
jgi:hypothetical protein